MSDRYRYYLWGEVIYRLTSEHEPAMLLSNERRWTPSILSARHIQHRFDVRKESEHYYLRELSEDDVARVLLAGSDAL